MIYFLNIFERYHLKKINIKFFEEIECVHLKLRFHILGDDPFNENVMKVFSSGKPGRLTGRGILIKKYDKISTPGQCAAYCNKMPVTKCLSFNYDFGSSQCELLEAIEGHDFKLSKVIVT